MFVDPLTIDERVLVSSASEQTDADDVRLQLANRWSRGFSDDLAPMTNSDDVSYPLIIPRDQISEVEEDIDRQIEARDYRLIEQSQAIAAFRPSSQST